MSESDLHPTPEYPDEIKSPDYGWQIYTAINQKEFYISFLVSPQDRFLFDQIRDVLRHRKIPGSPVRYTSWSGEELEIGFKEETIECIISDPLPGLYIFPYTPPSRTPVIRIDHTIFDSSIIEQLPEIRDEFSFYGMERKFGVTNFYKTPNSIIGIIEVGSKRDMVFYDLTTYLPYKIIHKRQYVTVEINISPEESRLDVKINM